MLNNKTKRNSIKNRQKKSKSTMSIWQTNDIDNETTIAMKNHNKL